jgi:hypothetical protein
MRFDRYDAGYEAGDDLLPDDTHECEIIKRKEWQAKDGSREALIVTFQAVDGTYQPVEKWFNPEEKRDHKAAMQLADAIGIPRDAEFDDSIIGRRVRVTTARGVSKRTGEPVVYCNAFAASSSPAFEQFREPEPAKAVAKRTPTQKADAASGTTNSDDIPF